MHRERGVLQERVEVGAVRRRRVRRRNGLEVASVNSRNPKLTTPSTPSTRAANRRGSRAEPNATATVHSAEHQDPQQQRALVRAPQRRHPVEQRQRRVGILRDIDDREIVADEGGDQAARRQRHHHELPGKRRYHRTDPALAPEHRTHDAEERLQRREQQREDQGELAELGQHGFSLPPGRPHPRPRGAVRRGTRRYGA